MAVCTSEGVRRARDDVPNTDENGSGYHSGVRRRDLVRARGAPCRDEENDRG